jgi:aspartate-semialdehyde dehydrogenase
MTLRVAVLGATTTIGQEILNVLAEREFPAGEVTALTARKGIGQELSFGERNLRAKDMDAFDWATADLCIMAVGDALARKWAPRITSAGCIAIDVSASFRMEADVPLVVAEVNASAVEGYGRRNLISSADPLVTMLTTALKPLHDEAVVKRVVAASYQSASGSGRPAMDELWTQTKSMFVNQAAEPREFPKQIAFNVIPQVDELMDDGFSEQEVRLAGETRRILGESIKLVSTCVQTPVFVGHCIAAHVELGRPLKAIEARRLLRQSPGLLVIDGREEETAYITPIECVGEWATYVSRIRDDDTVENGLAFWVVADNLRRGSALNAVQIAELLLNRGVFAARLAIGS